MDSSKESERFLKAYQDVAERVRRIELETKIARITLEDATTQLGVELGPEKSRKPGRTRKRR